MDRLLIIESNICLFFPGIYQRGEFATIKERRFRRRLRCLLIFRVLIFLLDLDLPQIG